MTDPSPSCSYVDVALVMQQMVRERETDRDVATMTIGDACGRPSIGSVRLDGEQRSFCADHVVQERILRD